MKKIFYRLKNRIKNNKGDSIAEVLVALLISSVALVMLASMISSSSSLTEKSKNLMRTYYDSSVAITERSGSSVAGSVNIKENGSVVGTYNVTYYINDDISGDPVVTYKYK